jgi:Tol biopolymer transport system component
MKSKLLALIFVGMVVVLIAFTFGQEASVIYGVPAAIPTSDEEDFGLALGTVGNTVVTGAPTFLDFPTTPSVFDTTVISSEFHSDEFAAKLSAESVSGTTEIVSISSNGTPGNTSSRYPSISADGQFVAFQSWASNLVANDTNNAVDVFVHDRQTGQTTRVSVASNGAEANGNDYFMYPAISADGRYVAFQSDASNLVANDTNNEPDIFVHDRQTGQTTRVSVASDGAQGNGWAVSPSLSGDGRYVAFMSKSNNLVSEDTNGSVDIFLHDQLAGQTTRLSVSSNGTQGNDWSGTPSISVGGRYIAFKSVATNLVGGDTNGLMDVFVHDRVLQQTARISVASDGSEANGHSSYSFPPSITADGRYVSFDSVATNLVIGDTNGVDDVFIHDRQTGQTARVSISSNGTQGNGPSDNATVSSDGKHIVFRSLASNLVSGDTNPEWDIFVRDLQQDSTEFVSVASDGTLSNGYSNSSSISSDGSQIAFESSARNLVPISTNIDFDVYVRTRKGNELTAAIQDIAKGTNAQLDLVLAEAGEIAQDGDYFAEKKRKDEIELVADAIIDSAGILAEGFDAVKEVEDLTKMQFPGVIGRGWGHVLGIKASHQAARNAFRDSLLREVTTANARYAAKEFFNGAHIYYAADSVDELAEDLLTDAMVKAGLQIGLQGDLALQSLIYPSQAELVDIFKQDISDTANNSIARLPFLTPEEEQAYIEDLTQRDKANNAMVTTLIRRAIPLHLARDDSEGGLGDWVSSFLAKYLIKGIALLYADGPGVLAVEAGAAYWNLYQNAQQLKEDIQMMTLAVEGMGGSLEVEKRMYLNTVHGIDNIAQGVQPQIAGGNVSAITNKSVGEYRLFGRWWWFERSAHTEIDVSNPTLYDTDYQVVSSYWKTGFLGTSNHLMVEEGVKVIPGSGSGTILVSYKQDDEGVAPDEGSTIEMELLGSTDTGTYYVTHESTSWVPTRITSSDAQQLASLAADDAPTVPYPIRTRVTMNQDSMTYTPYAWVDNPFTQTVGITLTQPLPVDILVVDANGGEVVGDSLRWHRVISPQSTVVFTHAVRYIGDGGQVVQYSEPQLEMVNLEGTAYATFTGEVEEFVSLSPLSAVGTPPNKIVQGERVTVPITVTNHLATLESSGTVGLSLIDFISDVEIYSDTQKIIVPAGGSQIVNLVIDTHNIAPADYLLVAHIKAGGMNDYKEIFAIYLGISWIEVHLPLIVVE